MLLSFLDYPQRVAMVFDRFIEAGGRGSGVSLMTDSAVIPTSRGVFLPRDVPASKATFEPSV